MKEYRSLVFLLLLIAVASIMTVTSCGGGGSDPNGEPCDQCGETDGFCQGEIIGAKKIPDFMLFNDFPRQDLKCNDGSSPRQAPAPEATGCPVTLTCLKRLGSGQRRCFPFSNQPLFRCRGDRADTSTNVPGTTATPVSTPACGNSVIETGEACDGSNFGGDTCATLCTPLNSATDVGTLTCDTGCSTVSFGSCMNIEVNSCAAP